MYSTILENFNTINNLMRQIDCRDLAQKLLPIVKSAGNSILQIYAAGTAESQSKVDGSPVTKADLAAHRVLVSQLVPLLPNCPVVSEEDGDSLGSRKPCGQFWLIDPLDGTKEFIARNGEFTVNVALIEEGRSVLGVVFAPALGPLYWGGQGIGSFRCLDERTVPLKVAISVVGGCHRVAASKSHLNDATQAFISRLGQVSLVQAGSSLKFCRVAEGAADIYPRLGPTCEWDTAAGQAVLEGAGGFVVDLLGHPLRYGKAQVLNPEFVATRDLALLPT